MTVMPALQPYRQALAPLSDAAVLERFDERLPRYTSYPTAPHFTPQVGAETYASWLDALAARSPVSLYLHVPFCEALCYYCGCHTTVARNPDRIAHYARLLVREMDLVAEAIGRRQRVSHIHWGGGTPTALAASDFVEISRAIGKRFHIEANAEIAVEIDPRHLDRDHMDAFAEAGVNRDAHVPWMKKHQQLIPADTLPDPAERLRQVRAAEAELAGAGYVAIGLDHFAMPNDPLAVAQSTGRLHRNFQGYTTDAAPALIGLGASSIGCLPQGYVQNSPNLKNHREAIERGRFATARGVELSESDRVRRTIIERLMCDLAVDLADVAVDARTTFAPELERLAGLAADGLVVIEGTKIVMPRSMRPFVRKIAAVFDAYLRHTDMRHSRAV